MSLTLALMCALPPLLLLLLGPCCRRAAACCRALPAVWV